MKNINFCSICKYKIHQGFQYVVVSKIKNFYLLYGLFKNETILEACGVYHSWN